MRNSNLINIAIIAFAAFFLACSEQGTGDNILSNGYTYKHHLKTGSDLPKPGEYVEFDLDLIKEGGEVLQSMRDAPQKPIIQIPKTEQEKQASMKNPLIGLLEVIGEGDSATVYIPIDSVPRPTPLMEGLDKIAYTLVTRRIISEEEYAAEKEAEFQKRQQLQEEGRKLAEEKKVYCEQLLKDYQAGKLQAQTKDLGKGLKLVLLDEGDGVKPQPGSNVDVNYYGMLEDGSSFDNSYKRGESFKFSLGKGQVIQGWDIGIGELGKGAKGLLDIPFELGYGAAGNPPTIPAEANLFFYVEMNDFK